jgi:hypothetical protein
MQLYIGIPVLIAESLIELGRLDAGLILWPQLDFFIQCKVQESYEEKERARTGIGRDDAGHHGLS